MRMLPHFDIELKKYVHSNSFELIYESSGIFDYSKINDAMEDLKQKLILQNLDKPSCKRLFGTLYSFDNFINSKSKFINLSSKIRKEL